MLDDEPAIVGRIAAQGDFRPEAYVAECVVSIAWYTNERTNDIRPEPHLPEGCRCFQDLFRKLVLTGFIGLLAPGTVLQSFCTCERCVVCIRGDIDCNRLSLQFWRSD